MLLLIFNHMHTSLILVASRKLCNINTYINVNRLNHVTKKQKVESLMYLQKCTCANFFRMYNVFKKYNELKSITYITGKCISYFSRATVCCSMKIIIYCSARKQCAALDLYDEKSTQLFLITNDKGLTLKNISLNQRYSLLIKLTICLRMFY